MIIDCHGHFTTAPKELQAFRDEQIEGLKHPGRAPSKRALAISDDQLREAVQPQLKFQNDRGTDVTIATRNGDVVVSVHDGVISLTVGNRTVTVPAGQGVRAERQGDEHDCGPGGGGFDRKSSRASQSAGGGA